MSQHTAGDVLVLVGGYGNKQMRMLHASLFQTRNGAGWRVDGHQVVTARFGQCIGLFLTFVDDYNVLIVSRQ